MRKNRHMWGAVIAAVLLIAGNVSAKGMQFTVRGGMNLFQANGADSDYVAGENDFPVTPAYQTPVLGIGLTFLGKASSFGVNVHYGLSTEVDQRDPSDGETVRVDTPKNLVAVFNFTKYFALSQKLQWFFSAGAGGEYLMVDDKEFVSDAGSLIVIQAPEKPFSPLAAAGLGVQYMLSDSLGLSFECQGAYIFRDPAQILITPVLALVLKF